MGFSSMSLTTMIVSLIKLVVAIILMSGSTLVEVESCNRYGSYRHQVDYSHLDNLDASKHPTLSEKIRAVVSSHYGGWGGGGSSHVNHGHAGGGVSYSHTAGGGGHGHQSSVSHGWDDSSNHHQEHHHEEHDDHSSKPGYQFAAHNHQKPVVVSPDKRNIMKIIRHRKVVVKQQSEKIK